MPSFTNHVLFCVRRVSLFKEENGLMGENTASGRNEELYLGALSDLLTFPLTALRCLRLGFKLS